MTSATNPTNTAHPAQRRSLSEILARLDYLRHGRALWKTCFEDDETFVDFYFTYCASQHYIAIRYDGTRPIAHIGFPSYWLRPTRESKQAVMIQYVSGACVLPEYRGQGIMREMLLEQLNALAGDIPTYVGLGLIPADEGLRGYYHRTLGFDTVGERYETDDLSAVIALGRTAPQLTALPLPHLLGHSLRVSGDGLYTSDLECESILLEYTLYPHTAVEAIPAEHPGATERVPYFSALCLARATDETLYIDYIIGTEAERRAMTDRLSARYGTTRTIIRLSTTEAEHLGVQGTPLGMLRLASIVRLLERCAADRPQLKDAFTYRDELLPQLSGSYYIEAGRVRHTAELDPALPERSHAELLRQYLGRSIDFRLLHE